MNSYFVCFTAMKFIVQMFLFQCVMAYQDRCPQFIEQNLQIKYTLTRGKCSVENPFHCLLKDNTETLKQSYYKNCKSWDWISKGFHPVLRGKYIDYEKCEAERYQPFPFLSNESHQCYFVKSYCAEEGQIEHMIGDESSDRTCKCDYTKRYAFHTIPRNKVFCIPSEEECTCLIKTCLTNQTMNEDYKCVDSLLHTNQTVYSINLTALIPIDDFDVIAVLDISIWKTDNFRIHFYLQIALSGTILSAIIFAISIFIYVALLDLEKGLQNKVATPETAARKSIVQPNVGIGTPAILENEQQSIREHKENNLMKTETDLSTPTEKADIVILHIEKEKNKTEVESFKFHLESLSKKMGYSGINIKMFEDIFHKKEDDSDFEIETVLKKCNYVFAYISDNFYTSKLSQLGLKEWCIKDALNDPETKKHIKIVRNCKYLPEYLHLSLQQEDVDLDFFEYNEKNPGVVMKYHKFYEDCLENIQHNDKTK